MKIITRRCCGLVLTIVGDAELQHKTQRELSIDLTFKLTNRLLSVTNNVIAYQHESSQDAERASLGTVHQNRSGQCNLIRSKYHDQQRR